tara:strand:- start:56 stop:289 length:234 start_codon:yes stop_codon:yes gene_type:complete
MKITNHSTKNNVFFSIKKGNWSIVFDKVSLGPAAGSLSFWSSGVFTGLIEEGDVKEALKLMRELEVKVTQEAEKVGI